MTYQEIYNAVADIRFNRSTSKIAQIKQWVNAAELFTWNAGDFVFKRVAAQTLVISAGSRTPLMPTTAGFLFAKSIGLYDDQGAKLTYLPPDEWEEAFLPDTSTGIPAYYTVINRQLYLGPTPDSTRSFKFSYQRRYCHLNNAAAVVDGTMSADTDTPLWDSEHHYQLVPRAIVIGAKLEGDPLPQNYLEEADALLQAMVADLVGGESLEAVKWGPNYEW